MAATHLPEISPASWEHPTDRAALRALQAIPGFDSVLRKVVGTFGERNVRLLYQANAVKVGPTQYRELHDMLLRVCDVLDVDVPELYLSQTPLPNAGAVGLDEPFIVLNSSLVEIATPTEVQAVIGHEVGHIASEHALYRTLLNLLLMLAATRTSLVGVAIRPIVLALLEWNRKAELSSDRAGLLAVQDVDASLGVLGKLAGGVRSHDGFDLEAFIAQSDEYLDTEGLDAFYRFTSMMGSTHPFAVVRVAELRKWIASGDYHRIVGGDYVRRGDEASVRESAGAGLTHYSSTARDTFENVGDYVTRTFTDLAERIEKFLDPDTDESGAPGERDSGQPDDWYDPFDEYL